ncbi:helix-turn-helix domain-containing protein [Synechococcales cyanobacterium C]|uniref:Helix-turn-helix domain-containing protein n=1 Tax=Petrachloros mirabilis ULC683 TaxID=2781853 RepID=A0A8K2A6L5_9CYAN|nr:helix-turn-helix transcriptional regulator [Petrachloros mirabilis]NCJ05335.1 helix-turn-helix domain-containing protein [Petrachloros mirabilis ULC683]
MTVLLETDKTDYAEVLRQAMARVGLQYWSELARTVGLTRSQLQKLRQGQIEQLPVAVVLRLSQVLQLSLSECLTQLSPQVFPNETQTLQQVRQEYQRLQEQMVTQQQQFQQQFQQSTLQALESWLLQWPKAAHAARQNPQAPAVKLLPLLRPLEQLLQSWEVAPIGEVGAQVAYDPQSHQLMQGREVAPGTPVRVDYVGYRHGMQLLHRAKVSLE